MLLTTGTAIPLRTQSENWRNKTHRLDSPSGEVLPHFQTLSQFMFKYSLYFRKKKQRTIKQQLWKWAQSTVMMLQLVCQSADRWKTPVAHFEQLRVMRHFLLTLVIQQSSFTPQAWGTTAAGGFWRAFPAQTSTGLLVIPCQEAIAAVTPEKRPVLLHRDLAACLSQQVLGADSDTQDPKPATQRGVSPLPPSQSKVFDTIIV